MTDDRCNRHRSGSIRSKTSQGGSSEKAPRHRFAISSLRGMQQVNGTLNPDTLRYADAFPA